MKLLILPETRLKTRQIFEWLEDGPAGLGEDFLQSLEASYLRIEKNPHQSPRTTFKTLEDRDLRKNKLRRFAIEVIYEIRRDEIVVLAVVSSW